jgi:hypothetical protein
MVIEREGNLPTAILSITNATRPTSEHGPSRPEPWFGTNRGKQLSWVKKRKRKWKNEGRTDRMKP